PTRRQLRRRFAGPLAERTTATLQEVAVNASCVGYGKTLTLDRLEIESPRAPRARPSEASEEWGTPAGFARRGRGAEPLAELGPELGRGDHPLEPAPIVPVGPPLLGDDPGGGAPHRELLAHALEVDALVAAAGVERMLAAKALLRDGVQLAGQVEHVDAAKAGEQRLAVDLSPERIRLVERPALHQVVGRIEAIGFVEHAFHERRQGERALGRLAVRRAQLEVTLQAHLREERGQVQVPVVQ